MGKNENSYKQKLEPPWRADRAGSIRRRPTAWGNATVAPRPNVNLKSHPRRRGRTTRGSNTRLAGETAKERTRERPRNGTPDRKRWRALPRRWLRQRARENRYAIAISSNRQKKNGGKAKNIPIAPRNNNNAKIKRCEEAKREIK